MQGIICGQQDDEIYLLGLALNASGLINRVVESIEKAIETWGDQPADFLLIVLSHNPEESVLQIHNLRSVITTPIIVIADPFSEDLQIRLYKAGVDLVITRPYSLRMLPYQINPLLLRNNSIPLVGLPDLVQPSFRLDTHARSAVIGDGPPIHLTQLEFRLLYTLMIHRGEALASEEIVNLVWGYDGDENRELVRGLVQRLRAKIEPDPQNPRFVLTDAGFGYLFNPHYEEL